MVTGPKRFLCTPHKNHLKYVFISKALFGSIRCILYDAIPFQYATGLAIMNNL
jgi:hypothetical protein